MKYSLAITLLFSHVLTAQNVEWINYNKDNSGIKSNSIFSITGDSTGRMYFGAGDDLQHGGLFRFDGINWKHYTPDNSALPSWNERYLLTDKNGIIWMTPESGYGLTKFDGTNFYTYTTSNSNLTSNYIDGLALDDSNNIWMAMTGVGDTMITKFNGTSFTNYVLPEGTIGGLLVEDSIVWAGAVDGLMKLNISTGVSTVWNQSNSNIPGTGVDAIYRDKSGTLWIGFYWGFVYGSGGLATFDGTTFTAYNALTSGNSWVPGWHDLESDTNNHLWLASRCEGLREFDGFTWNQIDTIPSYPQGCAGAVYIDRNKKLWYADVYSGIWTTTDAIATGLQTTYSRDFSYYPNPASDVLHVVIKNSEPENGVLLVKNILGQEVISKNISAQMHDISIDVSGLQHGIYFLSFNAEQKQSVVKWMKE